jgi:outer membrane protein OmpA-like peptidoglycan-associated protein
MLITSIVFAQGDVEGSKDHPLISRFAGSIIVYYDVKQFDEYIRALGKVEVERDEDNKRVFNLTKSKQLEGKVTRISYKAPKDRSILEVYRNYEPALKSAGFEILFTSSGKEIGDSYDWVRYFYESLNPLKRSARDGLIADEDRYQRYLSAKLSSPEGDVYVSLYVSLRYGCPKVQLDVIEVKPMETGLVTVNADALAKDIAKTGHVAIYGIYFDTDKADVKPESEPILKEIAKLLQQNPKLKLYVVGHTDNVGDLTYNMKLSQARAGAVVEELVSKYGVDAKRLKARGVGPLSPVVSNNTEEGRAKNRRVELVEQ